MAQRPWCDKPKCETPGEGVETITFTIGDGATMQAELCVNDLAYCRKIIEWARPYVPGSSAGTSPARLRSLFVDE